MNKYTEVIQEALESERGFRKIFCDLEDTFRFRFNWGSTHKLGELCLEAGANKLSYLYLLSIVDQETADEMIELLKEPA